MTANVTIRLHSGARKPLELVTNRKVMLAVRGQFDPPSKSRVHWLQNNQIDLTLSVPDKHGYALLAALKGHEHAGVVPLKVEAGRDIDLSLMLVNRDAEYCFDNARWDRLPLLSPERRILRGSTRNQPQDVGERYMRWLADHRDAAACFLNTVAALRLMPFSDGASPRNAADFIVAIDWQNLRRDRFFAYAKYELVTALEQANDFGREILPGIFHPGAKASFKQTTFREANVQITFHEQTLPSVDFGQLIRVELDMDYYHDPLSHALLEVVPNSLSFGRRKTDARRIYAMRWMAGRAHGIGDEFAPLYTLG